MIHIKRIIEKISRIPISAIEKAILYSISPKKIIEHSVTYTKEWCYKNEIRTVGDIKEKLLKMYNKNSIDNEIMQLVENDLKEYEQKSEIIMDQMRRQHFLTWKLILMDKIYILEEDIENDHPRIWSKRCGSCCTDIIDYCNNYFIHRNVYVSLDMIINEICENEKEESEFYFCLLEFKYPLLLKEIKSYLPIINKSVAIKDYRMSTIQKQIKSKFF